MPTRPTHLLLTVLRRGAVLLLGLTFACSAHAASVDAFVNAFTFGIGNTLIDDTSPGPSIYRAVNIDFSGPRFSSAEVESDFEAARIRLRTGGNLVSSGDAAGAIGRLSDTLTFSINQGENDFIELEIRFHLIGLLQFNPTGTNSNATLGMSLFSFDGDTTTDSLVSERFYANNPFINAGESVTAADPDNFLLVSQFGDIVFDNDDRGLVQGTIRLRGSSPTLTVDLSLTANGLVDFWDTASFEFVNLPGDVTFTSESGYFMAGSPDGDGDGIDDFSDNCTTLANADQIDTDGDGYGNACDADFNNDCIVNFIDLAAFSDAFLGTEALFDLNGDGSINFVDLARLSSAFFLPPGPGTGIC